MKRFRFLTALALVFVIGLSIGSLGQSFSLATTDGLTPHNVVAEATVFDGRAAVHVTEAPDAEAHTLLLLDNMQLKDGTIELDIAGMPRADAGTGARGFVGLAFHVASDASRYECFYLRPTNARANDQLRRNHTLQYVSEPEWPWHRLRSESPGKYESYADMQPGKWTHVKIDVEGTSAKLFIGGSEQPALLVNDLKMGAVAGEIALWIGPGTDAYFSGLKVEKR